MSKLDDVLDGMDGSRLPTATKVIAKLAIKALVTDKLSQLVRDGEIDMITTDVERIVESL